MNTLRFKQFINAPPPLVWRTMLDDATYRDWTSVFGSGSYYVGSWDKGAGIQFLGGPEGDGMIAEIAENQPHRFISIRHVGFVAKGVPDTTSDAVRAWAPAYENYTFIPKDGGTEVEIELTKFLPDLEAMFQDSWPRALARLKEICEA